MTDKAAGFSADEYVSRGWTLEQLVENGMMESTGPASPAASAGDTMGEPTAPKTTRRRTKKAESEAAAPEAPAAAPGVANTTVVGSGGLEDALAAKWD